MYFTLVKDQTHLSNCNPYTVVFLWSLGTCVSFESSSGFWVDLNSLLHYVGWIMLFICSLLETKRLNHCATTMPSESKRHIARKKKRWKSKKPYRRKRKGHFYMRAQRRRKFKLVQRSRTKKNTDTLIFEEMFKRQNRWNDHQDYFDLDDAGWFCKPSLHFYNCLHFNHFGQAFDDICNINPDIIPLLHSDAASFLQPLNDYNKSVLELLCPVDDRAVDLTRITSTKSLFRFHSIYNVETDGGSPIIFDTGASISISPNKDDFIELDCSTHALNSVSIKGIEGDSVARGVGKIRLTVHTNNGYRRTIETTAYYIPRARVRLLSVCRYQNEHRGEGCKFLLTDDECTFTFPSSVGGGDISFDCSETNFIPTTSSFAQRYIKPVASNHQRTYMVLYQDNINLTNAQKALLKFHFCLGHFNLPWLQSLIRKGILLPNDNNASDVNALCRCMACQMSKQVRRPTGTTITKIKKDKDGALKQNQLRPGGMISSDQFVSSLPGRLSNTFGREKEKRQIHGRNSLR